MLQAAPPRSVIVIITDCLSGVLAGGRFRHLPFGARAKCYRDDTLATIVELEDLHLVVVYLWVHSHVGKDRHTNGNGQ